MSETNRDNGLAPKLTAKEEHFAQLIALEGYKQSPAYRESHDVSPNSNPSTT